MTHIFGTRIGHKKKNTAKRVSQTSRAAAIEEARALKAANPGVSGPDLTDMLVTKRQNKGKTFRGIPLDRSKQRFRPARTR